MYDEKFLRQAIELAQENVRNGGRPFGAVLVKDGEVIATGVNETNATHDITAHAELLAVRRANEQLQTPFLEGTEMYASGQPCPMCMAAMHSAKVGKIYFAYSYEQGQSYGLSSTDVLDELKKPIGEQVIDIQHKTIDVEEHPYELWADQK
ncbi:nucleoside deaminase [Piscibacillus sp. B03]|uniref:nucleoside deaminase n=1 Tax=Piscibacillus sp. B03 TaxID=3457430 RepID=UPI003FCE8C15